MRITKDIAQQISFKLTDKSRKAAEILKKEYQTVVTDLYESAIPELVKNTFAKHPEWFYTRSYIDFTGHGFRYEQVTSTHAVICNKGTSAHLELTAKIADKIKSAFLKWEKANQACTDLKRETETALLNLRTFKQIGENIPEAKPFLPPPMSNSLIVNVDSLNRKLAKQPEITKNTTTQPA